MTKFFFICIFICLLVSCQIKQGSSSVSSFSSDDTVAVQTQGFPFPEIPVTLTEPEDRKAWLLTHYWEQFNFADTALVNNRDVTEQGFVNFIALLADGSTSEQLMRESLTRWCSQFMAEAHACKVLMQTADDYLYNPNSPFYNEALYGLYLEAVLDELPKEDVRRSAFNFKLTLLKRNNPGDKAMDFTYYLPDGTHRTLAATSVKGDRLLLVFYDPECESCHAVLQQMSDDVTLAKEVKEGLISVLAIYTEGNDEVWRKALPDMPKEWIIGTDHEAVKTGALYDLKAMPSLYLLDGQKRVVLKDVSFEQLSTAIKRG